MAPKLHRPAPAAFCPYCSYGLPTVPTGEGRFMICEFCGNILAARHIGQAEIKGEKIEVYRLRPASAEERETLRNSPEWPKLQAALNNTIHRGFWPYQSGKKEDAQNL